MKRTQPEQPDPPPIIRWNDGKQPPLIGGTNVVVQKRCYRLITPLFGGGFEPGVNDPDNLIRATEIRGQLRFWWRAMRGGQPEFGGNIEKMKAREDEIWGTASNTIKRVKQVKSENEQLEKKERWQGPVQITVSDYWQDESGQRIIPLPSYAAFPLTDQDGGMAKQTITSDHKGIACGVHFTVSLTYPFFSGEDRKLRNKLDMKLEVNAALWAWETFGGIGARTRRGFGAIQLEAVDAVPYTDLPGPDAEAAYVWLTAHMEQFRGKGPYPDDVPHVEIHDPSDKRQLLILEPGTEALETWHELIDKLQRFRRQPPSSFKKVNKWPEARAIREIASQSEEQSSKKNYTTSFPRSTFGFPLNFYFPDDENLKNVSLEGADEGRERFSSPLILRPLACQQQKTLGLALLLEGTRVPAGGINLVQRGDGESQQRSLNTVPIQLIDTGVIRTAFMDYLQNNYGKPSNRQNSRHNRKRNDKSFKRNRR